MITYTMYNNVILILLYTLIIKVSIFYLVFIDDIVLIIH